MSTLTASSASSDPTLERSFRGHKGAVTSVSFSPSMRQLASGAQDNLVMIWNFKPQLRAFRFLGHKGVVTSVEFSPTGHLLASASTDNTVRLWEPTVRGKCSILKAHSAPVRSVSWSSDARLLITASDDKTCKVWGSAGARFWCSLVGHTNWVRSAVLSRDTRLAASASDDKTVKLWDVHTHQCVETYYEHTAAVRSVRFHPHGSVVASASADNTIKLFDLRSHQMIQHYAAHDAAVNSIDFHPSGDFLLSGSDDSAIKVWDLREGHQLYTIHGHKGATLGVQWSPEGDFFASAGADQRVMTWATNFDKAAALADPTLIARRQRVHIAPSSAEKVAREQYEPQTQQVQAQDPSASFAQPQFDGPRTIHADTLPSGYGSSASYASGAYAAASPAASFGAVPQPQPHPDLPLQHECAYDHEHTPADSAPHAYHSSSQAHNHPRQSQAPSSSRVPATDYDLPSNHRELYPAPAAPTQSLASDVRAQGPSLLQAAGADLNAVRLPDQLTSTLHHIVTQLDVISRTVRDMESRLALHETKMEDLEARAVRRERNEAHQTVLADQQRAIDRQMREQVAAQQTRVQQQVRPPGA